ncbi:putative membrane protein [Clostridium bornimense]|uniref:Putative membrane protein n=1 Tax=Clostridium bornimense TaxID=1216932 RepID=W6RVE0_9CLOT|nr:hypothetical protein [Clostridium bornimense]CDM68298.1 putative membrane protein [Clostridium bornimense]
MYEILFYGGIVFSTIFLIISISIFFKFNIIEAIKYKITKISRKRISEKNYKKDEIVEMNIENENTIIIKNNNSVDNTELLTIAENYATALIAAEATTNILDEI